jgi:hypothetical protein
MSKITRIVAAASTLGVLGVAVLPVASFADMGAGEDINLSVTIDISNSDKGGNNEYGYTWTISDKDGNHNLGKDQPAGINSGGLAPFATSNILTSKVSSISSGTNVYGVKYTVIPNTDQPATIVSGTSYLDQANYFGIATDNSVGTFASGGSGMIDGITGTVGETHNNAIASGTYQNTLQYVASTNAAAL